MSRLPFDRMMLTAVIGCFGGMNCFSSSTMWGSTVVVVIASLLSDASLRFRQAGDPRGQLPGAFREERVQLLHRDTGELGDAADARRLTLARRVFAAEGDHLPVLLAQRRNAGFLGDLFADLRSPLAGVREKSFFIDRDRFTCVRSQRHINLLSVQSRAACRPSTFDSKLASATPAAVRSSRATGRRVFRGG